jgi:hypothetical protein
MEGLLTRLRNGDECIQAVDVSTRDDLEFQTIFPTNDNDTTPPEYRNIPTEWCQALQSNTHVRVIRLYASFLDTVDADPTRQSRFAILMELLSHLHNVQEIELHAFSVPTRLFPVLPMVHLVNRQATSLRKLALYNIRSEGIQSHTEGFRQQLAQVIATLTNLEELVWEPFPLVESSYDHNLILTESNHDDDDDSSSSSSYQAIDQALLSAVFGLPKLQKLSLCAKSFNVLVQHLQRLPLSRPYLVPLWNKSNLTTISLSGFTLTSDDLRVVLGISNHRNSTLQQQQQQQRKLEELHLTNCLLEEPAAILEYLKLNRTLRRLLLTDTWMGIQYRLDEEERELHHRHHHNNRVTTHDPYQQNDFLRHVAQILEYHNTTLHWVITRSPIEKVEIKDNDYASEETTTHPHQPQQHHSKLETLLQLNRSGLRDFSLVSQSQSTTSTSTTFCPPPMWADLLYKLGQTSPTVLANVLERNFEALFLKDT